ncbi:hydroxysteroid dehydrogenase-like protein 1 [Agrilus planipennis]|uniref:Hydroxysteroid dehydrogenase-like protein 1 n=1 Tax=Agrilus planipennis TaxID=224129 RepID=A0A7F5RIU7_AGRPL|nr:hydroxysteroid dehydrogenase-like protein 1 [Agrilus planipennis]
MWALMKFIYRISRFSMFCCNFYVIILAIIGLVAIFFYLSDTLWSFLQLSHSILAPYFLPQELQSLVKKYGSWALVTGSTDGIGKAYAKELAKRGVNIILVSRSQEKLHATAKEIETQCGVKTKVIAVDFSQGPKAVETVRRELGSIPVGILVNNVGKQYSYPMYLGEVPDQELWDIININVGAVTMMTKMIIEEMKNKGRGAIVNVSSGAELQPLPLMNVYSASKVYVKSFTMALRHEYSKYGITVQHLSPLFLNTKMNQFSNRLQESGLFVPDAETYAKSAVNLLGRVDHTTGYWAHGIQVI